MKSIQSKILAVVISCILIMTVAISAISLYMTNRILHRDADIILDTLCEKEALLINDTLDDIQECVSVMEHYISQELVNSAAIGNGVYRHTFTEKMKDMFTNIVPDTPGVVAFYLRYAPELTPPTSGFFVSRDGVGQEFTDFPPTDLSGFAPDDVEHVGWYFQPVAAGRPIWMEPYHNLNNGILMFSYVAPFYKNDELIGVVGMDLDFGLLLDKVNGISVYDNGKAYLMSSDGHTYYNDSERERHRIPRDESSYAESCAELNNGMTLLIRASYDDVQKDTIPVINTIIFTACGVLLLFSIVTTLITRRLISPLKKLTHAAQQLADGKTDVQVVCETRDEIGTLSAVFNQTVNDLHEYMNSINTLAYRDSLTGLRNRASYIKALEQLENRLSQGLSRFGVLMADVNWLKQVNDTYGHDIGSELIRRAAKIICGVFLHSPVYRVGGDEFVVFLENNDFANYTTLLEELDHACSEQKIDHNGVLIPISIARGVAVYDPDIDECVEDTFIRADQAMYSHKQMLKSNPPELPFPVTSPSAR